MRINLSVEHLETGTKNMPVDKSRCQICLILSKTFNFIPPRYTSVNFRVVVLQVMLVRKFGALSSGFSLVQQNIRTDSHLLGEIDWFSQLYINPQRIRYVRDICRHLVSPLYKFLMKISTPVTFVCCLVGTKGERAIIYSKIKKPYQDWFDSSKMKENKERD